VRKSGSIVEIGMKVRKILLHAATGVVVSLVGLGVAAAADYPPSKEADWVARGFRFHTGEVMPELRVRYTTVGAPSGEPVVVLHGTTGSGAGMLSPAFAGELFGPDQPLDATKYYIILPDAIGHGKTAKPSGGQRAKFPQYDYHDFVTAQYRLVGHGACTWRSNVWTYPGASSLGSDARRGLQDHPTVKPTAMLEDALLDLTNRGDFVLDPFLGSGSTLIAAENTGRICRGVELDPLYVDVIVRRYEATSGEAAVLVETGETFEDLEQRRARERASGKLLGTEN
jgi:hypothetical protein